MKIIANIFAAAGLLLLGYWTVEYFQARLFQAQERRRFETGIRTETRAESEQPPAVRKAEAERRSRGLRCRAWACPQWWWRAPGGKC